MLILTIERLQVGRQAFLFVSTLYTVHGALKLSIYILNHSEFHCNKSVFKG